MKNTLCPGANHFIVNELCVCVFVHVFYFSKKNSFDMSGHQLWRVLDVDLYLRSSAKLVDVVLGG